MSRCIVAQGCYICTLASGTTAMSFFHQLHQSSGPISDFDFDDSLLQRSSDEDCALAQESGSRIGPEQPVVIDIEAGAFAPACSCACTAGFWIAFNLLQNNMHQCRCTLLRPLLPIRTGDCSGAGSQGCLE